MRVLAAPKHCTGQLCGVPPRAAAADAGLSSTMWNESMRRLRDAARKATPTVWSDYEGSGGRSQ